MQLEKSYALGWYVFGAILLSYFVLQIAYTFYLKHVVLLDLFSIASGFVLRAVGGAAVLQVTITPWWLMCVLFLALFLGLGKRRNELLVLADGAGSAADLAGILAAFSRKPDRDRCHMYDHGL